MVNERRGLHNSGGCALIIVAAGPKRTGKPGLFGMDNRRGDLGAVRVGHDARPNPREVRRVIGGNRLSVCSDGDRLHRFHPAIFAGRPAVADVVRLRNRRAGTAR